MPTFAYEYKGPSGDVKKGNVEAADVHAAKARLKLMKIQPTNIKKKGIEINIAMPAFLKPKVATKDLVIFTRQFATMIDSGLPRSSV